MELSSEEKIILDRVMREEIESLASENEIDANVAEAKAPELPKTMPNMPCITAPKDGGWSA
eukprot:SAG11_NODE_585_length_8349_cov_38.121939_2_plen_61_part_00